ncbi:MAG: putative copper-importing P-type ATPase [Bacteroidota bacterium]
MNNLEPKTNLQVDGMTCSNCALGVAKMLEKKGLQQVSVDFTTGDVSFLEVKPDQLPAIEAGIRSLGYSVVKRHQDGTSENTKTRFPSNKQEWLLLICSILTLPLLAHMVLNYQLLHNPWFQWVLSTPVFIIGIYHFGRSAWNSLRSGVPNMDVLITIGSTAAYLYSIAGTLMYAEHHGAHNYLFFETSATIITLIMLGNVIEGRSVRKTTSALRELASMQPANAELISIDKNMQERLETVPSDKLKPGDKVMLQSGSVIPADGELYWGELSVDESSMTGESIPVQKSINSNVIAGTMILSGTGKFVVRKSGSNTLLAAIVELVKRAQQSKPEIQKLGDKVSSWFVPAVVLISIIAFFVNLFAWERTISESLMNAIAVLVISCPCAMGLATPTAVAVGLGAAAKKGILIKGGSTLEQFNGIRTVVFDKTGTLTTGKFRVAEMRLNQMDQQEAYDIIHSIEQHSNHPIARSLVSELAGKSKKQILFAQVSEEKGIGMAATDMQGNHYELRNGKEDNCDLLLIRNNVKSVFIQIRDEIRPGAAELVTWLHSRKIQTLMVSGDRKENCERVAKEIGIQKFHSGKLPDEKTIIIQELRKSGPVLMMGDGINDAPSLETSDIGVSFGEASSIATNAADVVLMRQSDLRILIETWNTGNMTLTTIKQNLFWAFAYNIVAIPIAAAGFLSPMVAALSMAFSDVIVIGNSLRMRLRLK